MDRVQSPRIASIARVGSDIELDPDYLKPPALPRQCRELVAGIINGNCFSQNQDFKSASICRAGPPRSVTIPSFDIRPGPGHS